MPAAATAAAAEVPAPVRRRGPVIGLAGTAITAGSFLALLSIMAGLDPITVNGEMPFMDGLFGDLFTDVSDEAVIFPGDSAEFAHHLPPEGGPLFWAVEITDYEDGDAFSVSASDAFGNEVYGPRAASAPVVLDTILEQGTGQLTFSVRNDGGRPVTAVMMFNADLEGSDVFGDNGSPLLAALAPLAAAAVAMLAGLATMAAGAVIALFDWRKTRGRGRTSGEWRGGTSSTTTRWD